MKRFTTFLLMTLMSIIVWGQTQVPPKSSSPIYFKDGKVGIGTTAPDGPLHIKGGIAIQNPHIGYDSHGDAGERAGIIFGSNHAKYNSMFWISPDATKGNRLNIGVGNRYKDINTKLSIANNGNVGIGTTSPKAKLDVAGTIRATEIEVKAQTADFVFDENYPLRTLDEVEEFIKTKGHLPSIPSAECMEKNGVNLAEMNKLLLQKIEELTLYTIEQEGKLKEKDKVVEELKAESKRQRTEMKMQKTDLEAMKNELAEIKALLLNK
jgi:hypothetical protein